MSPSAKVPEIIYSNESNPHLIIYAFSPHSIQVHLWHLIIQPIMIFIS